MHMQINITTDIEVKSLSDLPKLKILMESLKMKINKSKLARDMGVDRRTIDKYLNGYEPKSIRKRTSKIDDYYEIIALFQKSPSKNFITSEFYGNT